ncbi:MULTISPECIES: Arc family DNA-binding protein [Serratia]|uniref:Arc family DNA-binding protein n=1 Tax=Serratia TaxID=613 RepID=UPI0009304077|nr:MULTISPECIES: Arc family DNA-binding protein [Serratia]MDR8482062.1 Arc family DNA-binding protein [Serratia nevei]TWY38099.1 Arc family DNA-binding protein [Serratia marcescens]TYR90471.1 Arc family DNA-binding protein [Serratia marcescens]
MNSETTYRNNAQLKLRLPEEVKNLIQQKAQREGLSMNAAIVQRLVWSLDEDRKNGQQ